EGRVVGRIFEQTQVRQRVLDLGALEETQAAVDPVGNAGAEKSMFDDARLGVRPVEHSDLAAPLSFGNEVADLVDQPGGLVAVGLRFVDTNLLAVSFRRPEILAE